MEFNDYPLQGAATRKLLQSRHGDNEALRAADLPTFYDKLLSKLWHGKMDPETAASLGPLAVEFAWLGARRPYYSVWPHVVDGLTRVPLALSACQLRLPMPALLLRFAAGQEPQFGEQRLRSVLVHVVPGELEFVGTDGSILRVGTPGVVAWSVLSDVGLLDSDGLPSPHRCYAKLTPDITVEQLLAGMAANDVAFTGAAPLGADTAAAMRFAVRIVAGCCLLAQDPDIVVPDVLAADRQRYDETGDLKYVEKAQRRGKIGWNVGARLEMDPHYRRAHLGLRWCGKGRTEPRIVPISGCLVKRQKLKEVPTGYLDDEVCPTCGSYRVPQTGLCAHCQKAEHDAHATTHAACQPG